MNLIEQKLKRDIIPWVESAEQFNKWTQYRIYLMYFWFGEVFILLVGLGFSHPAFRVLAPNAATTTQNADSTFPIINGLGEGVMFWAAIFGLVAWGLLKIYTQRNELEKRCSLIKSGRLTLRQCRLEIDDACRDSNPLIKLTKVQEKINEQVNRMFAEDAWPWPRGVAPGIEGVINQEVARYVRDYSSSWTELPESNDVQQLS